MKICLFVVNRFYGYKLGTDHVAKLKYYIVIVMAILCIVWLCLLLWKDTGWNIYFLIKQIISSNFILRVRSLNNSVA